MERPAACDLIRGNKAVDLFLRIKSQAAGRSAVFVFLPLDHARVLHVFKNKANLHIGTSARVRVSELQTAV